MCAASARHARSTIGLNDLRIEPAEPDAARHSGQRHRRHRFFAVRARLVDHLAPHPVRRLHRLHAVHLAAITFQHLRARLMTRWKRRQRFGQSQRRESVSASPRNPAVGEVNEHAILALEATRVRKQHARQMIQIAFAARHSARARQNDGHHEHVVGPTRPMLRVAGGAATFSASSAP